MGKKKAEMIRRFGAVLLAAGFVLAQAVPAMAEEAGPAAEEDGNAAAETGSIAADNGTVAVEYDQLATLVQQNQDLKSATENYTTNKKNYESMLATLNDERDYMRLLADKYEDEDAEAEQNYKTNASMLSSSITRITKQLERLNGVSSQTSLQKTTDSYVLTAQNLMNTYNQMVVNAAAKEKSAQAAEASYQSLIKKQSAGMATAAEVLEAADNLSQQKNLRDSYQQQMDQARFNLLFTLGIDSGTSVTIGTIPAPDMTAITAIDLASDLEKAIGNSSGVQSVRHSAGGTYTEMDLKAKREAAAEGEVRAAVQDSYNQLQADALSYQAALDSYESASMIWQSMQRRKQAGMVDQTSFLEGEATYLEALAAKETASMTLRQSWESYCWEVKGVS
ncbi:MAG: TolC family protein [Lachnospiraceae bacterium]|nr:TolC family protein [Lachnospiraceae bacterium]